MSPIILPLFGPLAIHSFGLMTALGILFFTFLVNHDARRKALMSSETLHQIIFVGLMGGLVGGRMLALLGDDSYQYKSIFEWFALWDGGLSSLGCVIGVLASWIIYVPLLKIPVLAFFDLTARYASVIHIFVRLGCFLAGCCYGCPTTLPWAIMYSHPDSLAPLGISLHPTQLYSVVALVIIAEVIYLLGNTAFHRGELLGWYLLLTNSERFVVDFFRGDREFVHHALLDVLSLHQWLALVLASIGIALILWARYKQPVVTHA